MYTLQSANINEFFGKINFSGTGKVFLNNTEYTLINNIDQLLAARDNPTGHYVLGNDLGAASNDRITTTNWTKALDNDAEFTGMFNGLGHVIISSRTTARSIFGTIGKDALVSNLGMPSSTILALANNPKTSAGILADINRGSIVNAFVGGTLSITLSNQATNIQSAGGLVGTNTGTGLIAQTNTSAIVSGVKKGVAGGLVGTNEAGGLIIDSSAHATSGQKVESATSGTTVTYMGGLVGVNDGDLKRSYTDNSVRLIDTTNTTSIAGSFVGKNTGTIDESYACWSYGEDYSTGPQLGGFVGENTATGRITNAYTTSLYNDGQNKVLTKWNAGFAYKNAGTIENAYATMYSANSTNPERFGFVKENTGAITNGYWYADAASEATAVTDNPISGVTHFTDTVAGDGTVTMSAATKAATFSNYAFSSGPSIWAASVSGYPILKNLPVYVMTDVSSAPAIPVYGVATSDANTLNLLARGLQGGGGPLISRDMVSLFYPAANPFIAATVNGYVDAGTHNAADALSSPAYTNLKGFVRVDPKQLVIVGVVADKTYDGTTSATLRTDRAKNGLAGLVDDQTLTINYTSAAFADKNAGQDKTVNLTYTLTDGANGCKKSNYTIGNTTTTTITPKTVTAATTGADTKTYDGTTDATVSSWNFSGMIAGDDLSINPLTYSAAFSDTNAGTNKKVSVSDLSLTGADAGNYTLQNTSLTTKGTIDKRALILAGEKPSDGKATIPASDLTIMNAVAGDVVTLGGSATLSSSAEGVREITNLDALTLNNPNYTKVGSVGHVVVGSNNIRQLDGSLPSGVTITLTPSQNKTTLSTTEDKTILNWLRFNIASNETVDFTQPNTYSIVLNQVTGNEASVIAGALTSNGRVFIINSNGVLFTANATVNVAGLVASALTLTNPDVYVFTASGNGSIINKGDIIIADSGFVALASNNTVTHSGSITALNGKALLVAADKLTLNVTNTTLNSYTIEDLKGTTSLYAYDGTTPVYGRVNVTGGLIETAGRKLALPTSSDYWPKTGMNGTWSLSLPSVTVGTGGNLTHNLVQDNLNTRNLSLNALEGDLTIGTPTGTDTITWDKNTTLTLNAKDDIYINKSLTATGDYAGLVMDYGNDYHILTPATYSGAVLDANGEPVAKEAPAGVTYASITLSGDHASLKIHGNDYTLIRDMSQLDDLDKANGISGLYYNPRSEAYDTSVNPIAPSITNYKNASSGSYYYNPATDAYDIVKAQIIDGVHVYYNLETKAYDRTTGYPTTGNVINRYYYNPENGLYDIPSWSPTAAKWYDPSTGTYQLSSRYSGTTSYWNPLTDTYDKTDLNTASGKYYNPATGGYTASSRVTVSGPLYFNPMTGYYEYAMTSPYPASGYYALAGDLVASGTTYSISPIISLSGTLSGLGHTIKNLVINASPSQQYTGLVGQAIAGSVIRDVGVVDANVTGSVITGILAGQVTAGTVSHAYTTGSVSAQAGSVGGLVGVTSGTAFISDSYSTAEGVGLRGGLIGTTNAGTSVARSNAIGVGGQGGLVGDAASTSIADSYAIGAATLGGLVGNATGAGSIVNSFAIGNVVSEGNFGGGLVGNLTISSGGSFTVDNSYATGSVTSTNFTAQTGGGIGGLIGYGGPAGSDTATTLTIKNSHAIGKVTVSGSAQAIGGVGGLIGRMYLGTAGSVGYIINSYAIGPVTVSNVPHVGGLGGSLYNVHVIGSHSDGDVKGNQNVGGLVGTMGGQGSLINSYAKGLVTGNRYVGGLAGAIDKDIRVENCYWRSENNSRAFGGPRIDPGGFSKALTKQEFLDVGNYINHTIEQVQADRNPPPVNPTDPPVNPPDDNPVGPSPTERAATDQGSRTTGEALQRDTTPSRETGAATSFTGRQSSSWLDDYIIFADSDSYSATIKSITVEKDEEENKKK